MVAGGNKGAEIMKIKNSTFYIQSVLLGREHAIQTNNSISNGQPTNLVALNQEYLILVNEVASWTITVFYY